MNVTPIKTRLFREGGDLFDFIAIHAPSLKNGTILMVTSKIVALAEGRTVEIKNEKEKIRIIKEEGEWAKRTKYVWLTMKDGMLLANAGIDESNADGKLVLLPNDSFKVAAQLRKQLLKHYKIKKLGVLIIDSRVMPLRAGVTAVALGYAGFRGLRDYRGTKDLFGRRMKFSQTNVADSLATAATLAMGEGSERQPLCVIEDAPVEFSDRINAKELRIPFEDDMYRPLFRTAARKKKR